MSRVREATLVTVLRSGGRYDALWVERLARGVQRFAPVFTRIVCLTDLDLKVAGVETVPFRHDWPGWWSKMEAFRAGLATGTVVLLDLDTILAGDASALATPGLAAMEDHFLEGRVSSAILRWESDQLGFLYEAFAAEPERLMQAGSCGSVPNSVHGDQVVIDHLLRRHGISPTFIQAAHPGLLDFYDPKKRSYAPIVIFIGDAKPDTAVEPVRSLWLGHDIDAAA